MWSGVPGLVTWPGALLPISPSRQGRHLLKTLLIHRPDHGQGCLDHQYVKIIPPASTSKVLNPGRMSELPEQVSKPAVRAFLPTPTDSDVTRGGARHWGLALLCFVFSRTPGPEMKEGTSYRSYWHEKDNKGML